MNGKSITDDFSNSGFTLKPSAQFSLNDFIAGRKTSFTGSIHDGGFEQGGEVLGGLDDVTVEVKSFKLIRQLPAEHKQTTFTVSDLANTFETNVISSRRNTQKIVNTTTGKVLWCVVGPDFFDACTKE